MFVPRWREIEISQPRPVPGQFSAKTDPLEVKSVEAARWDRAEKAGELMSFRVESGSMPQQPAYDRFGEKPPFSLDACRPAPPSRSISPTQISWPDLLNRIESKGEYMPRFGASTWPSNSVIPAFQVSTSRIPAHWYCRVCSR
jgi:hypothetical protein